uniref:ATP synthase F0 subunit 8 n=1 Tax=Romanomermis culicivorax TaxID=13658 RepID=A0A915HQ65_ROMCU
MNILDKLLAQFHGQALLIILWSYMLGGAFLFSWLERETELSGYVNVKRGEDAVIISINNTIKGITKYINVRYSNNKTYFIWITNELVSLE